ncbi:hypothetical protein ACFFWC_19865 [Plantactinospora siamensis]|uniref:DUF3618 domain-containing protein n=1 Tax=Plantactinospora siamensis TaxID=555372 RepID=A0ABV6P2M7_9ACTN
MTDPTTPVSRQGYPPTSATYGQPVDPGYPADTTVDTGAGVDGSTREQVTEQGKQVGQHAAQAGGEVAQTAKQEGREVAHEAKAQARDLLGEAKGQLHGQARQQQQRAASGLRGIGAELRSMTDRSESAGPATELVRQASGRIDGVADWLENREPGHLVEDVRGYARQHPLAFLAGAAVLGVLAGRLTKNVAAASNGGSGSAGQGGGYNAAGAGYNGSGAGYTAGSGAGYTAGSGAGYTAGSGAGYGGAGYSEAARPAGMPTPTFEEPVPGGGVYSSNAAGASYAPGTAAGYAGAPETGAGYADAGGTVGGTGYEPTVPTGYENPPAGGQAGYGAEPTGYGPADEGRYGDGTDAQGRRA